MLPALRSIVIDILHRGDDHELVEDLLFRCMIRVLQPKEVVVSRSMTESVICRDCLDQCIPTTYVAGVRAR
jgi:hypothetical protein